MINKNKKPSFFSQPMVLLLTIVLVCGILFCIFIPYGAGFDEEAHLVRIFDVSGLNFVPNRGTENGNFTLSEFYSLSYQRRNFQNPAFDQFLPSYYSVKADWQNMSEGTTRSHYFPANYFLQAIVAGIFWRIFDFPIFPVVVLMRIIALVFYLFSCYLTFRMLPIGKWVFLVVALTPMALFQAATINADIFTLSCSFLFIGATLEYYARRDVETNHPVPWKLVILILLVGFTKPGTILLLPLLLILTKRKPGSKKVLLIILLAVLISIVVSAKWMSFSVEDANFLLWTKKRTLSGQAQIILANLLDFIRYYFQGIVNSLANYYTGIVGVYGYWVGKVPFVIYLIFPISILFALLCEDKDVRFNRPPRLLFFVVGLLCLAGIAAFHFIAFYVPNTDNVDKVGRYFLPFMPLLLIPFAGRLVIKEQIRKIPLLLCIGALVASIGFYGYGIYRTYYTECVYPVTESRPCVLPVYKNVDLKNPYIAHLTNETAVKQSFISKCSEIQSVSVRVETITASPEGMFTIDILDHNQELLATKGFDLSDVTPGDTIEVPANLKSVQTEPVLWINLKMNSSNSEMADLGLLGRVSGDIYPEGELFFNGKEQNGDLIFKYTCN
jgi:uncharacterized membrane protein